MTEKVLSQVQTAEIRFLQKVHGMTLRDKVCSCGRCKVLNVELVLL